MIQRDRYNIYYLTRLNTPSYKFWQPGRNKKEKKKRWIKESSSEIHPSHQSPTHFIDEICVKQHACVIAYPLSRRQFEMAEEEEQMYDEGGYEEEIPVDGSGGSTVDMQVILNSDERVWTKIDVLTPMVYYFSLPTLGVRSDEEEIRGDGGSSCFGKRRLAQIHV